MGANEAPGMDNLDPSSMVGRLYVQDQITLLHTKISCGSHGFREEDYLSFCHYKSMGAIDPQGCDQIGPRDLIGGIYVEDHYSHCYTLNI